MATPMQEPDPGPLDALDSGSVAELVRDGVEVSHSGAVPATHSPLPPRAGGHPGTDVPDEASALVADLDAFRA